MLIYHKEIRAGLVTMREKIMRKLFGRCRKNGGSASAYAPCRITLLGSGCAKEKDDAIQLFKFFGNIRFIMLPLFFTAMGALYVGYLRVANQAPNQSILIENIVLIAGIAVSSFFVLYEVAYSKVSAATSELLPKDLKEHLRHRGLSNYCYLFMTLFGVGLAVFVSAYYPWMTKNGAPPPAPQIVLFLYALSTAFWFGVFAGGLLCALLSGMVFQLLSAFGIDIRIKIHKESAKPYIGTVTSATCVLYFIPGIFCLYLLQLNVDNTLRGAFQVSRQCLLKEEDVIHVNTLETGEYSLDVKFNDQALARLNQEGAGIFRPRRINFTVGRNVWSYAHPGGKWSNPVRIAIADSGTLAVLKKELEDQSKPCGFAGRE